jgi:diaminopimelate decarboxylase
VHVLRLMKSEGVLVDAVSGGELERALRAGYTGKGEPAGVVFTADVIDDAALDRVIELDVPVNAGSAEMLEQVGRRKPGHRVWVRVNPGFGHGHSRKTNTGGPWSKHGIWHEYLDESLRVVEKHRLDLVGVHMHIGSGADFEHLGRVCDAMVAQVRALGLDVRALSGGGGLPIPYKPDQTPFDTAALHALWDEARKQVEATLGHRVSLEIEPGRYIVAEAGFLVAEVRAVKQIASRTFVLLDAGFNALARPVMYGSYHPMSLAPSDGAPRAEREVVVGGPLCESGDIFTQDEGGVIRTQRLPEARVGDFVVIECAGAYGFAMASNYNSKPRPAEVLVRGGKALLARARETSADLLRGEVIPGE